MSEPSQSIILCEGYHDRAFWQGWLLTHLGYVDPGARPGAARTDVWDPWDKKVGSGQFGFISPSGHFIRVVPCQGKQNVPSAARRYLKDRKINRVARVVLNVDSDSEAGIVPQTNASIAALLALAKTVEPTAQQIDETHVALDTGSTVLSSIRWETDAAETTGVPIKQTLERLVCSAMAAAYPARAQSVQSWLDARPDPPPPEVKEFAWAYMAGWFAEKNCDYFYSNLWEIKPIADELVKRLTASGAWKIAASLDVPPTP